MSESPAVLHDEAFGIVPIFPVDKADVSSYLFLLVQHHEGHWGFPKGHAELDESPLVTACRELTEETGISQYQLIPDISFEESYEFIKKGEKTQKNVTYFLAFVDAMTVQTQAEEIKNFAWNPFAETKELITYPANRRVLEQVRQYLHDKFA